jgi:hypothetical protein
LGLFMLSHLLANANLMLLFVFFLLFFCLNHVEPLGLTINSTMQVSKVVFSNKVFLN